MQCFVMHRHEVFNLLFRLLLSLYLIYQDSKAQNELVLLWITRSSIYFEWIAWLGFVQGLVCCLWVSKWLIFEVWNSMLWLLPKTEKPKMFKCGVSERTLVFLKNFILKCCTCNDFHVLQNRSGNTPVIWNVECTLLIFSCISHHE